MAAAKFSTQQYQYSDVTVQIGDRVLAGCRGVSYKRTQDKEPVYGKGNEPMAIQRGNKKYEGELTLLQGELEILIAGAPKGDLLDYRNLNITVGYGNEDGFVVDQLSGVEFTDSEKAIKQEDKFMEVTLPIIFLKLKNNV